MKKYLVVTADSNDGDTLLTKISEISEIDLSIIKTSLEIIKEKGYVWSTYEDTANDPKIFYKDLIDIEIIDILSEYIPYDIYRIDSISLLEVINETRLI